MKLKEAMERCKVRGYIERDKYDHPRIYKNSTAWAEIPGSLWPADQDADDWSCYDPETEDFATVG